MNNRHILGIVLSLIFVNSSALATVGFSATGYSNVISENGTTTYYYSNIADTVTGGLYDNATAAGSSCSTTRNPNCKAPGSFFTINVSTTGTPTAASKMTLYADYTTVPTSGTVLTPGQIVGSASYTVANSTYTFSTLTFAQFCAAVANTNCLSDNLIRISVIFDKDGNGTYDTAAGDEIASFTLAVVSQMYQYSNTAVAGDGVVSFTAFPGDEKIYILNPQYGSGSEFPSLINTIGVQYVRYYYQAGTSNATMTASGSNYGQADINVDTSNNVSFTPGYVKGLVNGTDYCVITALVDKAGNIGLETAPGDRSANQCARPDQVIGLMSQSGQCFIATAAFDSPLASQVDTLRKFRDVYLLKSQIGRNFVSWYYDHSPAWAAKIKNNENLKSITRAFLWPLVGYSFLSLKWGAANATLFAVTLLLLPLLLLQLAFRKRELE